MTWERWKVCEVCGSGRWGGTRQAWEAFVVCWQHTIGTSIQRLLLRCFSQNRGPTTSPGDNKLHTPSPSPSCRWSPAEMTSGRPWEVLGMQGREGIWFAGSSVSFESLSAVMEYNKLLLRQMVPRRHSFEHNFGWFFSVASKKQQITHKILKKYLWRESLYISVDRPQLVPLV